MTDEGKQTRSITLALVNARLDTVIEKLAEWKDDFDDWEGRLRTLELAFERLEPTIKLLARVSAILGGLVIALLFELLTGRVSLNFP